MCARELLCGCFDEEEAARSSLLAAGYGAAASAMCVRRGNAVAGCLELCGIYGVGKSNYEFHTLGQTVQHGDARL